MMAAMLQLLNSYGEVTKGFRVLFFKIVNLLSLIAIFTL